MRLRLFFALLFALLLAPAAHADTGAVAALNAQVAARGVWGNTSSFTPTVFSVGSSTANLCVQKVGQAQNFAPLAAKWLSVPFPCYHQPSAGSDEEEVLLTPTDTYEFWGMEYNRIGFPWIWSARWGGHEANADFTQYVGGIRAWPATEARYGTQASGIAFVPGIITVADLRSGVINHAVEISAAWACHAKRFPATGTDGSDTANCLQYGTLFTLPDTFDCSSLNRYVGTLVCRAAQKFGLIVTDQSHDKVAFRFENYKRKWASWSPDGSVVNPYTDLNQKARGLDFFGCDGFQNGVAKAPGQEADCYPAEYGVFYHFPWDQLVEANG
jgi:hypothetical protein